jgi:hypothetical protein
MDIELKIVKIKLESLRNILHILLYFRNPTDKIVVYCSQQLDKVIVKHHRCKKTLYNNRTVATY